VLRDPFEGGTRGVRRVGSVQRLGFWVRRGVFGVLLVSLGAALGGGAMLAMGGLGPKAEEHEVTVRESPSLLLAVRDLARLETTELHFEKVIEVSDAQKRAFGLVEAKDSVLLVAVGDATVGVDLSKLEEGDVSLSEDGRATMRLPSPELLSVRLDEQKTYVHHRATDVLARRNEGLEGQARREAVAAIEKGARESDAFKRARGQAERTLRALALSLGVKDVDFVWR